MDQFGQTCRELHYKFLKIVRNKQSSFRIKFSGKVIYIDPFQISEENHDADYIFITHEHFDHFDNQSIKNILKNESIIVTNKLVADLLNSSDITINQSSVVVLEPNDHLDIDKWVSVDTKTAYNLNKFKEPGIVYHPKENKGLGFVITINGSEDSVKIYHMGDTDFLPKEQVIENSDILMIPVGGTYVMTWQEAVTANDQIKPLVSIPMHFGNRAGILQDATEFVQKIANQGEII